MNDTIVAISTALGVGAIAIVRLSGPDALSIASQLFKEKDLTKVKSHTISYGHIYDNDELIDEVLVSVMKAPKTYTTEDIVEINCHGGIIATNKVLQLCLTKGARLADRGEFTKRAFLNGRIDLAESEAVMDIIESKSDEARKLAVSNLKGNISNLIQNYRTNLKNLLSSIEVNIDYPEYYDIEVVTLEKLNTEIKKLKCDLQNLIDLSENTNYLKNGIKTVIVGKPNVGKSSILNNLLQEEKAIVTNIAGTTRDTVEGEIYLDGILLNIIDTAGIRQTNDLVEKIGVNKSLSLIDEADLVITVLNSNEELSSEDEEILNKTKDKLRIIVLNKTDLPRHLEIDNLENIISTTALNADGLKPLKDKIKELFNLEKLKVSDSAYLANTRQISLAKKAYQNLEDAELSLQNNNPIDMIEIDLKACFDTLGEIIGITYSDEIIDNLFANFCVGK